MDPVARRSLLESMIYVTRDTGRTIMFSSHLLDDVERVADHVAVLDRSVLRAAGPIDSLTGAMRQYHLSFAGAAPPRDVPPVRGLLSSRRSATGLRVIVVRPDAETRAALESLRPNAIDEGPVAFADAVVGYLGTRDQHDYLEDPAMAGAEV